jgi:iron complex transport system substrate-binding protein
MQPDLIVGFGLNNSNPSLIFYKKSGLKVMFNGDWTEQSLLEKPNGLSFLVLYTDSIPRHSVFSEIERIQRYFGLAKKSDNETSSKRSYVPRSVVRTTRRKLLYF